MSLYQWQVTFENGTRTTVVSPDKISRTEAIRRAESTTPLKAIQAVPIIERK